MNNNSAKVGPPERLSSLDPLQVACQDVLAWFFPKKKYGETTVDEIYNYV